MQKLVESWFCLLKITAIACLVLMVIFVFGNVVLRYVFNTGITFSEEASRLLFIYLTFLGAIIALREHLHLGVDSLVSRLPAVGKRLCLLLSQGLMLYATWLLLQGSWQQAVINVETRTPVTGISMAVVYGVGVIFSVSTGVMLISSLIRAACGQMSNAGVAQAIGTIQAPVEVAVQAESQTVRTPVLRVTEV